MIEKIKRFIKRKLTEKIKKKVGYIGENSNVNYPITVDKPQNLRISDFVYIGPGAWISCHGIVTIKRGSIIGPRLKIYTGNHNFDSEVAIPYDNITFAKSVTVNENVWIGGDVIIMPGVEIGEGCVVAGGAVVTKSFPDCCVIGGNPAKIIKERDKTNYFRLKSEDKIYLKMKQQGIFKTVIQEN